jgi:hypothetical protein
MKLHWIKTSTIGKKIVNKKGEIKNDEGHKKKKRKKKQKISESILIRWIEKKKIIIIKTNMHHVYIILSLSHFAFLPPFSKMVQLYIKNKEWLYAVGLFLLTNVIFWSMLTHFSETKKNLIPLFTWLQTYSIFFLHMDRLCAVVSSIYGFIFLAYPHKDCILFLKQFFFFGFISCIGKVFQARFNYWPYCCCHALWHVGVAKILYDSLILKPNKK